MTRWLTFMGSFVADLTFRSERLPPWGETVMGGDFHLGPGGKGSNQAVAAARLGAQVCFIGKLGRDPFGELARRTWREEGIDTEFCCETTNRGTGAAAVIVNPAGGENAIVVDPGSGMLLDVDDVEAAASRIQESVVFVTQFELAMPVVARGLFIAKRAGAITILNPAPAAPIPAHVYDLCDYLTPNESEAATLVGYPVKTLEDAERAALTLRARGVPNVVITLGAQGAMVVNERVTQHIPAHDAGPVIETTGAGDSFTGAFAVGLSEGMDLVAAATFGCRAAGISVTRLGTAASMPRRVELGT